MLMNKSSQYDRLCRMVEQSAGRSIQTTGDFEWLSDAITQKLGQRLSSTTLKRVWGYISEDVQPRRYTLDVLARFIGYRNYDHFLHGGNAQSRFFTAEVLYAKDIPSGGLLSLTWPPDRHCVIAPIGGGNFKVLRATNTKLSVGDTFRCEVFLQHQPLFMTRLVHNGDEYAGYVAGQQDGIVWQII